MANPAIEKIECTSVYFMKEFHVLVIVTGIMKALSGRTPSSRCVGTFLRGFQATGRAMYTHGTCDTNRWRTLPVSRGVELPSGSEAFLPKGFSRIENKAESRPFRDTETDSLVSAERASLPSFLLFSQSCSYHFLIFKKYSQTFNKVLFYYSIFIFEITIQSQHSSFAFPPSKPSYIPLPALF